jgi:cation-transporting P-type ATPase 13A2
LLLIRALFGIVGFILTIPEDVETKTHGNIDFNRLLNFITLCI